MSDVSAAFERLDPRIRRWIWEQRWNELRDVQEASINAILGDGARDVLLSAATAAGKTEAAFLPLLTRQLVYPGPGLRILYVSPLRALINDQFGRLELLCENLEIPVHRWHSDVDAGRKRQVLRNPSGILLITPESLEALFVRQGTTVPRLFRTLDAVVVDELHAFLGSERGRQLQSLLHRLEDVAGRRIPRVALSATLSDLDAAADYLRPGEGPAVTRIVSRAAGQEIRAQVRAYLHRIPPQEAIDTEAEEEPVEDDEGNAVDGDSRAAIAEHLFSALRGTHNLVFTKQRWDVEFYTDLLARRCEAERVPMEFFPHHGNLSRELRESVEERLRDRSRPVTAVCTSTLELGIDIGQMHSIAQISDPPSVAALRQRAGRSGRRGEPCRLRLYAREQEITGETPLPDMLRLETVQLTVMLQLLIQGWIEPPRAEALHLSTLIQQTLSVLTERGGMRAPDLYALLCGGGPFRTVDRTLFAEFLRCLHARQLIIQSPDGLLLPGPAGERLTAHYSFFAAFATPEEYRLVAEGRTLGTLPIVMVLLPGAFLVYAGRRWTVLKVDEAKKVIDLAPAPGGAPPKFGGEGVWVHRSVREQMRAFYRGEDLPPFLDTVAKEMVTEGRDHFRRFGLYGKYILPAGAGSWLFLWTGDTEAATLLLELRRRDIRAHGNGVCLQIDREDPDTVRAALSEIARYGFADPVTLAYLAPNKRSEKHDPYLSEPLLAAQYASKFLDTDAAMQVVRRVLGWDFATSAGSTR